MSLIPKRAKDTGSTTVVMSRMDYEIAKRVYEFTLAKGLTDEEVSFLMGKRNKYFFDLLNPTEKDKIKTEQLDILPTILQIPVRQIVPNDVKPGEQVKLYASKKVTATKTTYRHIVIATDGSESEPIIWIKKSAKGNRKQVNERLHTTILQFIDDEYFKQYRNALEIHLRLKEKSTFDFTPADLQKSLLDLARTVKNISILKRAIEDARYVYIKS
jgi:hypothetical protein